MATHPEIICQWQGFQNIWPTGSLCWGWERLLLARCCSATPCLPLHVVPVRQIRGVGRRREQVKQDNSWRSQPTDTGLAPVEAPLISKRKKSGRWGELMHDMLMDSDGARWSCHLRRSWGTTRHPQTGRPWE